jgi:hypothetical protein
VYDEKQWYSEYHYGMLEEEWANRNKVEFNNSVSN